MTDTWREFFIPGRLCLFGEHSDWAGGYRRINADVAVGEAIVCGTDCGVHAKARITGNGTTPVLEYRTSHTPGNEVCVCPLDNQAELQRMAASDSFFAYVAGTILEVNRHFNISRPGIRVEIDNYVSTLPTKKGLSSSAAICVLIVRVLNVLFDLNMSVCGEMDFAYRGELNTRSRCGRLDQCVAYGPGAIVRMIFDGERVETELMRPVAPYYLVIVDLKGAKDTKTILQALNSAYPFPSSEKEKSLHDFLGSTNAKLLARVRELFASERDQGKAAEQLGKLMVEAQDLFDRFAAPFCPQELTSPLLHSVLAHDWKGLVTGGKGVGSQGDGTAQLCCVSEAAQAEVVSIIDQHFKMEAIPLTIPAAKSVRRAVVPIAGFAGAMWPHSKAVGPWFLPVMTRYGPSNEMIVKPAVSFILEELVASDIEEIILICSECTETQLRTVFCKRQGVSALHMVSQDLRDFDEKLLSIGQKLKFVRQEEPSGLCKALAACKSLFPTDEPFILVFGDHLLRSTHATKSCIAQLIEHFEHNTTGVVAGVEWVTDEQVESVGVFQCAPKEGQAKCFTVTNVAEKPTAKQARDLFVVQGGPSQQHCFVGSFGSFVMRSGHLFSALDSLQGNPQWVDILNSIRQELSGGFVAGLIEGRRWDLGLPDSYRDCMKMMVDKGI